MKFLILSFLFIPVFAGATVWKVQPGVNAITKAVELAHAHDTIDVYAGTYKEQNLLIKKPVVLRGINRPLLDGEKKYELISVWSSNVVVEGFELKNSGRSSMNDFAGIKVYNAEKVTIRNNILRDMFFGIYFQGCQKSTA